MITYKKYFQLSYMVMVVAASSYIRMLDIVQMQRHIIVICGPHNVVVLELTDLFACKV